MWQPLQIVPTPARGKFVDSLLDNPNYAAEEKYDGDRRIGQITYTQGEHGFQTPVMVFTGRRVSDVDGKMVDKTLNVPHITLAKSAPNWGYDSALMERMLRLDGTVLDGECVLPADFIMPEDSADGGRSRWITKVMGSLPEKAILRQSTSIEEGGVGGKLRYAVFDIQFLRGRDLRDLPLSERRKWLLEAVTVLNNPYVFAADHVVEHKRAFLERILDGKGEGIILKDLHANIGPKTHLSWIKRKVEMNADVVIMGFDPPKQFSEKTTGEVSETKYWKNKWIGAIQFGQYRDGFLWPCGTASGMDDQLRAEFSKSPEQYIGRVVEIQANGREATGAFRHPRFKQFRDDKYTTDCVYNTNES